ncbi:MULTISPECIES: 5-dehydro-2-deoxygluconokinase [Streptomyces]|uniref:5-dehydro-2-deoxygluconokinase n=1 Tax=Streptomyces tsukubensis (strain DSM 42081 / NBRC 108919 / NRRL 18488 / 9993) TaxID=1114943 RepID=I2MYI5_STRT9|nr:MULTISPECIES: 5-dehydro-2-deoxygluconokinase [Streptomyces]AZK94144.1 5-dehydro-2-deoxygluconokinase [Streptomyces tsukubensis]EIF89832.1 IolC protein [Streptomyces tsukubensis NRRL18488]MYS63503.1 5-dehydro-2-deoxygluconokinase [Streptomyces sp. SID5473]QKM69751.1 5-dehydro-2-deoxygluconokinase [Streptomyces tsukubensis NRRL18488]TAI46281.1 5-dehydro-2-deoxygluconokinase [Streptomyces tsukubensis]
MPQPYDPPPYDVITMGRIGVDLYPLRTGVPLAEADTFGKFLGGSASNVAVGAARLGRRTAVITRTGSDPFGEYLHRALRDFGVDDRWVTPVPAYPTPVTFCEIFPPDDFPLYFYRQPKAPDLEIRTDELDLAEIRRARVFWVTGTGLSAEPSRGATQAALAHRDRAGLTVLDLDWRPMFWRDPETARPYYREALGFATVAVGNVDECEIATGERDPETAARALLAAGAELAVVKQGPKGVLALHRDGTRAEVPPVPVEVVNGLGAGDAFGGALCHGLLAGLPLEQVMRYANAAGAIVAARLACSSAMPYPDEVEQVLAGGPVPPERTPPPTAQSPTAQSPSAQPPSGPAPGTATPGTAVPGAPS